MERQNQEIQRVKFPNRIRQVISENHYTVDEVAEETGIPLRSLYDYCAGRTKISRDRIDLIAQVIGCSPTDLVPTIYLADGTLRCEYGQADIERPGESTLDRLRRSLLQLLLGAGSTITLPEFNDTWERLAYALNHPYRVDDAALMRLEQLTDTYWGLYQGTMAKIDFLGGLQGHLATTTKLLQTPQPTTTLARLCTVASRTAQMVGEIYLNMTDIHRAMQYRQFAIELAHEGQCSVLEAIALGRKAFLSLYAGEPQEALPSLREAYQQAEGKASGQSLAWIAIMEAEALSCLKSDETHRIIEKVENLLSEVSQYGEDRHWTSFNKARFAAYKGACYVRLHQPQEAQRVLSLALQGLPPGPTSREALILTDLAKSFIQQGEIEEACVTASQSLAYAARTKSTRALQEVRAVHRQLTPWKKQPEVKRLSEQLKSVKFL